MSTTHPKASTRGTIVVPVTLDAETRSADGALRLSGLAAPYGRESQDIGFYEEIREGAFDQSLVGSDILLLWQHDRAQPLARESAGNLEVRSTSRGIEFSATLPDTTTARDAVTLVRSGVVSEMSFGFQVQADRWESREGRQVRIVERAKLLEASLVTEAAYGKETNVQNRSKAELQARIERTVARHRLNRPAGTPSPYTPDGEQSYFRDLLVVRMDAERRMAASQAGVERFGPLGDPSFLRDRAHGGVAEARARLQALGRHLEETRDLTTTNTDGGGFIPGNVTGAPIHVAQAFATAVRARGVLPGIFPVSPLPERGMEIGTPKITSGVPVELQATENTAASESDIVEAKVTSPVGTLIGFEDVSLQLLEQGEPGADEWLAAELGRALATELDEQLFTGSGTRPYPIGLDAVVAAGGTTTTYTDASPTRPEAWAAIAECAATVGTALGAPADVAILHGRRLAWFGSWRDSAGAAPTPAPWGAIGLTPYACNSVTVLAGASTNEDRVYIARASELPVYLAPVRFEVMRQTPVLSQAGTVRVRAYRYYSTLFNRRPEALGVVAGTGLGGVTY